MIASLGQKPERMKTSLTHQATKIWRPPYHELLPDGSLRQMFLPELLAEIVSPLHYMGNDLLVEKCLNQITLGSCCLVCREWNKAFTPLLYEEIVLNDDLKFTSTALLRRTIWHDRPDHGSLIKRIT